MNPAAWDIFEKKRERRFPFLIIKKDMRMPTLLEGWDTPRRGTIFRFLFLSKKDDDKVQPGVGPGDGIGKHTLKKNEIEPHSNRAKKVGTHALLWDKTRGVGPSLKRKKERGGFPKNVFFLRTNPAAWDQKRIDHRGIRTHARRLVP